MPIDRRERSGELVEGVMVAMEGKQATIWTAMPGILQSFDPAKKTCVVQPALQAQVQKPDGTAEWVKLPLLLDCPVQFQGNAAYTLTFPLVQGDEGLVVFASRCIDAWWQSGGVQVQAEFRMHDLSDGFFLPGVSSVPNVHPNISTDEVHLRNAAGTRKLRLAAAELEVLVPGASVKLTDNTATVAATTINLNGSVIINGEAYVAHKHSGVTAGASNTGPKA